MGVCVPERVLHEAWRRTDGSRKPVAASDGARYRILYSGMPGGSFGPDFRDAVFEAEDGSEVHGDVEIHTEASDWYAHGHDSDERYNRVIFHAVGASPRDGFQTLNSLGMAVAEIDIEPLFEDADRFGNRRATTGDGEIDARDMVGEWLETAGDERFAQKIASKRIDIDRFGPDLALQMAIFEGLGYPRNGAGFRHLAQRLPWAFLARFAYLGDAESQNGGVMEHDVCRAGALVRWAAGFDPKPVWSPVPRLVGDAPAWIAAAGRPANRPQARVNAAAHFVACWWRSGGPMRHALNALTADGRATRPRDAYRVGNGVLGIGRAGEIVVNAVLPTVAAWAEIGGDADLYRIAMRMYREHPSLPTNSVLREAAQTIERRGPPIGRIAGARRQQGAIHIYKSMLLRPRAAIQMRLGRRALSS